MLYACKTVNESGTCTEWVAFSGGLLPPLTVDQALTLGGAVVMCWIVAWGVRVVANQINNRSL